MATHFTGKKTERCVGEGDLCIRERWQTSYGTDAERREDACGTCDLLPTKPTKITPSLKPFEAVVNAARIIRIRNKAGYFVKESDMSPFEFETLILIEHEFQQFEDSLKVQQAETFGMIQGFLKGS